MNGIVPASPAVFARADRAPSARGKPRGNVAIRLAAALLIYFTAMYTYLGVLLLAGGVDRTRTDYAFLSTMNVGIGLFLSATVFAVYRWLDRGSALRFGFGLRRRDAGFALSACAVSVVGAVVFALWRAGTDAELGAVFHAGKLLDASFWLLLVYGGTGWFVGVLQEEVFNRGYIVSNMSRLGPAGMIVLSSVLFSLTHIPTKGFVPLQLATHAIGGICYAYVYLKSGSIWVSTAVHACHNLVLDVLFNADYGITLVTFAQSPGDLDKLIQQTILAAAVMLIAFLYYGKNGLLTPAANLQAFYQSKNAKGE